MLRGQYAVYSLKRLPSGDLARDEVGRFTLEGDEQTNAAGLRHVRDNPQVVGYEVDQNAQMVYLDGRMMPLASFEGLEVRLEQVEDLSQVATE